ncbi:DUF6702 family protein [Lunatimonas salinarum]|uniref:DUF6702 family protein n=1 Tax=Lunatimonas salinarum TaxID=1774590 RepID=UPI001AE09B3D|nr:DUF6702 family protein [Lunatimonas salinarum]
MFNLLITLYYLLIWVAPHPFYISLTDMVYNSEKGRIEIAQKIFWDDLEVALSRESNEKVNFLQPRDSRALNKLAETYLLTHNLLVINGAEIKLSYLGFELDDDAAWFYFEAEKIPLPKSVRIQNTILFDDFPTQQNIVNFYLNKSPKSIITSKSIPEGEITF